MPVPVCRDEALPVTRRDLRRSYNSNGAAAP
ncbi:hypothetical protein SAMN06296416_102253 [Pseudoxanthomonas wuyuanensis]|uniref:Uncharacterized protein n=1 Tax=Pseudoxanthomonas wuyuanensis TaxID=1073196 RepID=A0A286D3A5_9GAMM|nr:hypothetical protein SAMN06296416_102253 [Pseudoxanthomonas wuyuanensis]